jgi:hypothetical protein
MTYIAMKPNYRIFTIAKSRLDIVSNFDRKLNFGITYFIAKIPGFISLIYYFQTVTKNNHYRFTSGRGIMFLTEFD